MAADNLKHCQVCGRIKSDRPTLFLEQLLPTEIDKAVCLCDFASRGSGTKISIRTCRSCKKKIVQDDRTGTITQWIFRFDICRCEVHDPLDEFVQIELAAPPMRSAAKEDHNSLSTENEHVIEVHQFPSQRYEPIEILGRGTSGTAYLCNDRNLNKTVVLKVLNNLVKEQIISFQKEAKITSKLRHPCIIEVLDFGIELDIPYMVLECVDAISLSSYLEERGIMDLSELKIIMTEICDALQYVHDRGFFHRDIKSSNILLIINEDSIRVKLIDFGFAIADHGIQEPTIVNGRTIIG
ncbi:MAG: serine/threonine protein kinase, partial [Cyanobacteria bacterium]|nr:serine/threonine protein kinase [Cyanobacteriota bacterium]